MKSWSQANKCIRQALDIANQLIALADKGDLNSRDDSCHVLYGVICDCGYKIRARAEAEREAHKMRGVWDDEAV